MDARTLHGGRNSADVHEGLSCQNSHFQLAGELFPQSLHNAVLNRHLACVGKWIWTEGLLLALAGHRSDGESGFTAETLPTFPIHYSGYIPPALSFHIHLFSLLPIFSCYLHKEIPHLHNITYVFIIHTAAAAAAAGYYLLDS